MEHLTYPEYEAKYMKTDHKVPEEPPHWTSRQVLFPLFIVIALLSITLYAMATSLWDLATVHQEEFLDLCSTPEGMLAILIISTALGFRLSVSARSDLADYRFMKSYSKESLRFDLCFLIITGMLGIVGVAIASYLFFFKAEEIYLGNQFLCDFIFHLLTEIFSIFWIKIIAFVLGGFFIYKAIDWYLDIKHTEKCVQSSD